MRFDIQIKINNAQSLLDDAKNIETSEIENFLKKLDFEENLLTFCLARVKNQSDALSIRQMISHIELTRKCISVNLESEK